MVSRATLLCHGGPGEWKYSLTHCDAFLLRVLTPRPCIVAAASSCIRLWEYAACLLLTFDSHSPLLGFNGGMLLWCITIGAAPGSISLNCNAENSDEFCRSNIIS